MKDVQKLSMAHETYVHIENPTHVETKNNKTALEPIMFKELVEASMTLHNILFQFVD